MSAWRTLSHSGSRRSQSIDQAPLALATGAHFVPIRTIDRALDCVREAFYVARAERKPVVLSVPLDLQTEESRALEHVPEPELDLSAILGPPIDDIMRLLLEPHADDRVAEAVVAYRADYGQNGLFDSLPYSGIAQALAEMRQVRCDLRRA